MGDFSRLGGNYCLGDGCGALRLGGVVVKRVKRGCKGGGDLGGSFLREGVDGAAVLCDQRGGGVDRGFGLAPFQVEGCVPSCFTRCAQYRATSTPSRSEERRC